MKGKYKMSKQELIKRLAQKGFLREDKCLYCKGIQCINKGNPSDKKLGSTMGKGEDQVNIDEYREK